MTLAEFAWAVFAYCTMLDASVTSWIRTRQRNRLVAGVTHSPHQVGLGVDVIYDAPLARSAREAWAERLGLTLIVDMDHDHLQPRGWRAG